MPHLVKNYYKKNRRLNEFQINIILFVKDKTPTSCSFNGPENQNNRQEKVSQGLEILPQLAVQYMNSLKLIKINLRQMSFCQNIQYKKGSLYIKILYRTKGSLLFRHYDKNSQPWTRKNILAKTSVDPLYPIDPHYPTLP